MPTLIVYLPADPAGSRAAATGYDYAVVRDDGPLATHGRAAAPLLPTTARGTDMVAVVPAHALSWHRVRLPARVADSVLSARTEPSRVRAVLTGAMEELLLDDTSDLHFAVFAPDAPDAPLWVAVCDLAWLRNALAPLEAAGLVLSRLVAESEPLAGAAASGTEPADPASTAGPARLVVTTATEPAQVALSTLGGVCVLPLQATALALTLAHSPLEVLAEPAVMGLTEQWLGSAAGPVSVQAQTLPQRLAQAACSRRNLAQLELSPSRRGRVAKRLAAAWHTVYHTPAWRPFRWACVALLLVQVVALNMAAWRHKTLLAQKRQDTENLLSQTFPEVKSILDAPLQMQREVRSLALSRGVGDTDLASLLTAVATVTAGDANKTVTALDFADGELRLKASGLTQADADTLTAALGPQSWAVRWQDGQLQFKRKSGSD